MQTKWSWFERKFDFNFPPEKMPDILERLRGTPVRIEQIVVEVSPDKLQNKVDGTWSIQENVGHLADLEPLWLGRVNDILAGDEVMREADLTNQKTFAADHHDQTIEETQRGFRKLRGQLIACIDSLDTNQYSATALHPRLMQPMRIVDLCYFVAEHDDYHLARMAYLKHC